MYAFRLAILRIRSCPEYAPRIVRFPARRAATLKLERRALEAIKLGQSELPSPPKKPVEGALCRPEAANGGPLRVTLRRCERLAKPYS
jgi:hypothetical protein